MLFLHLRAYNIKYTRVMLYIIVIVFGTAFHVAVNVK